MKTLKLTLLILTLFAITNCGGKKQGTTEATLSLGFGTIGDSTLVDGGVMVYGWSHDGTERFGFLYNDQVVNLKNGGWQFVALGWDDNPLQGTLRCAEANVQLNGTDTTVNLNLNTGNCTNPIFGSADTRQTDGQPYQLSFKTCANESCMYDSDDSYRPAIRGVAQSFEIALAGQDNQGNPDLNSSVIGPCDVHTGDDPKITSANSKLPIINLPVVTVIRAYDSNNCTGTFEEYLFYNGIREPLGQRSFYHSDPGNNENIIALKSDLCKETAPATGSSFRFSSSTDDLHIICNASQFNAVSALPDTNHQQATYVLGRDIDISAITTLNPIGTSGTPFQGTFNGNGHALTGLNVNNALGNDSGIFGYVQGTSNASMATISDLTLSNITILNSATDASSFGALIGNANNFVRVNSIITNNVEVEASNCPSSCSNIGGLVGNMSDTSNYSEVYDVVMQNTDIVTTQNASNIGGMVGSISNAAAVRYSVNNGVTFTHTSNATSSKFGGIAGYLNGELYDVTAVVNMDDTDVNVDFDVSNTIGGVVGQTSTNARVVYAYSSGNIKTPSAASKIGGSIGEVTGGQMIQDIVSYVNIDSTGNELGGIVGSIASSNNIELKRIRNFGQLLDCMDNCGGIVGKMDSSTNEAKLEQAHNYGAVTSQGDHTGGIIGYFTGTTNGGEIRYAHNEGAITGHDMVGGLVGTRSYSSTHGAILFAYNTANVVADTGSAYQAAGLVANVGSFDSGVIDDLYFATGTVAGDVTDDAFAGYSPSGSPPASNSVCHLPNGATDGNGLCTVFGSVNDENTLSNFTTFTGGEWDDDPSGTKPPIIFNWSAIMTLGDNKLGSQTDPFEISTTTQWNAISDSTELMDKSFKLIADLNFGSTDGNFRPIGSVSYPFAGRLDGNNFTIRNVTIVETQDRPVGLFRVLGTTDFGGGNYGNGARIGDNDYDYSTTKKLYLENFDITGYNGSNSYVGGLVGLIDDQGTYEYNGVQVTDVELISGTITGGGTNTPAIGGLIGHLDYEAPGTRIGDLVNYATVNGCGIQKGGGVIGQVTDSGGHSADSVMIEYLVNYGTVDCSSTDYVGGVVGFSNFNSPSFEILQNHGTVNGEDSVGGLVGSLNSSLMMSFNKGNVTGLTEVGGIVGNTGSAAANIVASYVQGTITSTGSGGDAGGIAGGCSTCGISNSYSVATVDATGGGGALARPLKAPIAGGTLSNNYYLHTIDLSVTGGNFLNNFTDFQNPANFSNLSTGLGSDDPWIHFPGDLPRFHFELFPELFEL